MVDRVLGSPLPLEDSPYLLDRHGPIFIVGSPRSGTTFLSSCIASINRVEQFAGVLAPPRLMHLIALRSSQSCREDCQHLLNVMRDVFWQAFWRRILFRTERVAQVFARRKSLRWALMRPTLDGRLFCYKEPFLCFAVDEICNYFTAAKIVHIVRDGRDNADSMLRSYPHALCDEVLGDLWLATNKNSEIGIPRAFGKHYVPWWIEAGEEEQFLHCSQYGRCIWMWREMVSRVIACGRQIGPERYLELRYESVVREPLKNAERILNFLKLSASGSLLNRLKRGHSASIGIGRKRQTANALNDAGRIAGPLLDTLGYV
jgi:hypothetical protein